VNNFLEQEIGIVEDYFAKVGVVALKLKSDLNVGDTIHIKGHTTDLIQTVTSMQIEHQQVQSAKSGDSVGIKVSDRVRKGDIVYKVIP
jgi:putative protease